MHRHLFQTVIAVFIFTLLLLGSKTIGAAPDDYGSSKAFIEANHQFSQGNYAEAVSLYSDITAKVRNGKLFYNLGNAYLKLGNVGKAILNYKNAQAYSPRDQDLKANLKFARQLTKDKFEQKAGSSIIRTVCFWYDALNQRELMVALLIINGVFWTLALLRIWFRNEVLYWSCLASFVLLILFGATLATKLYHSTFLKEGVIITAELPVRAGNGPNNTVLFYLHEGTEFRITDRNPGWLRIELADGKKGWVQRKFVGVVGEFEEARSTSPSQPLESRLEYPALS